MDPSKRERTFLIQGKNGYKQCLLINLNIMLFRFYSSPNNTSRVSVVGIHENGVLKIAVSRSSEKDHFIRKKGRMIAEGRLAKGKIHSQYNLPGCDIQEFIRYAKNIANDVLLTKQVV